LVMKRAPIERAAAIAGQNGGVVSVLPLRKGKAGLIITGNEVYHGLIEDRFAPILTRKLTDLDCEVDRISFAPDNTEIIRQAIYTHIERGCDLVLLSGGMSVDPDDVTRKGIRLAGAEEIHYGAAALPGAMFLRTTVLDLVLPRILSGEKIGKKELAFLGHGGLCQDCPECTYPHCAFGKGS
ncbi:MAG: molybdopterin-binding protein, partial [Deltaproteobacteria bacterium]|nr:molybdopterin-binding protein [Deltaproteobacteria bacterium]